MFAAGNCFWKDDQARAEIDAVFAREYLDFHKKVVVLDDDPTGIQTVHDIDVYTDWTKESLKAGFSSPENLFFVLTNSRSFSAEKTADAHREMARNAVEAAREAGVDFMMISRGDSTLRGHYPLETKVLRETLTQAADKVFDGEILCPFFKEGGRFTADGVHYVKEGTELVPAAQTEFAKDKTFGYSHSSLAEYIEEKSGNTVSAETVITVRLEELRGLKLKEIEERLYRLKGFHYIVVDAMEEADVKAFAIVLMRLMKRGREYLIRSAAAVPKVFGNVPDRPLLSREELIGEETAYGGMVLVGSHVKKTTSQLECLREADCPMEWIEFHVDAWQRDGGLEEEAVLATRKAEAAMAEGRTAVVYTSRTLLAPKEATPEEMLAISVKISDAVTSVVNRLGRKPRFLIAKGGITSSDVGTRGLEVKKARVLGQAQPGIPVWKTGAESKFPGMSYIIFPGNVGEVSTLRKIVETLA
ncbi:MAG: hydroxyacid dehydrogenase [Lachnospiraceae bacterium]|nr:hydroxyacid dehydrogenase [Lachnospiraceae bacterium]